MHPALRLEEILFNIFGHCYPPTLTGKKAGCASPATADLAALARTCRTFKEPALDVLWTELVNLSPLARCIPEASHQVYPGFIGLYAFTRPLKKTEWDILRGYTHRVRSVLDFTRGLSWESVKALFDPHREPVFPNLRTLRWQFLRETFPLMPHLAAESLTSLDIDLIGGDVLPFRSFPLSLGELCPNMKRFRVRMGRPHLDSDDYISSLVRCWTSLQVLYCPYINLDIDALSHLSYTSSLTTLSFTLSPVVADQIIPFKFTIPFFKLRDLEISSHSLESISKLLARIQLPTLRSLTVYVDSCPSNRSLKSFFAALARVCTHHRLISLRVIQTRPPSPTSSGSRRHQLTLDDIRPCMSFDCLRRIDLNTDWTVNLVDADLQELACAWPDLEYLMINEEWGWRTEAGITPNGLLQLLLGLKSLHHFCLAIDTRGYIDVPSILGSLRMVDFTPRIPFSVNVADSVIQPESVDALATFFGAIMQRRHPDVRSWYWNTSTMSDRLDSEALRRLWEDVFVKAHERVKAHSPVSQTVTEGF